MQKGEGGGRDEEQSGRKEGVEERGERREGRERYKFKCYIALNS